MAANDQPQRYVWIPPPYSTTANGLLQASRDASREPLHNGGGFSYKPLAQNEYDGEEDEEAQEHESDKARRLAELKTTVFDTYAICAALLASFACSTSFIPEAELIQDTWWRYRTIQLQQFLVRVCIIGAIHAMLVFMFCALYAKSALARQSYGLEIYDRFSQETGSIRQGAFWSMYYTAVLYCFQIAISTVYSLPAVLAWVCSGVLFIILVRVVWDAQSIIKAAGCVFMTDAQLEVLLEEAQS